MDQDSKEPVNSWRGISDYPSFISGIWGDAQLQATIAGREVTDRFVKGCRNFRVLDLDPFSYCALCKTPLFFAEWTNGDMDEKPVSITQHHAMHWNVPGYLFRWYNGPEPVVVPDPDGGWEGEEESCPSTEKGYKCWQKNAKENLPKCASCQRKVQAMRVQVRLVYDPALRQKVKEEIGDMSYLEFSRWVETQFPKHVQVCPGKVMEIVSDPEIIHLQVDNDRLRAENENLRKLLAELLAR